MIENYIEKELIGSGAFGDIFLGYDKVNKCNVAIKKILIENFKAKNIKMLLTEIKIGFYNNCEFLIKIKDFFINDNVVYIIINYCNQLDLRKFKKEKLINDDNRHQIISNILRGLQYLHVNKIIHRDIKLANIMMNNNKPFLGDFGTCRILPENKYFTNTCIGTPYYLSPEIIGGDKYNLKVDIYSLGCLFCEIYYNKRPYNANNIYALYKNVLESQKDVVIDTNTKIGKVIDSMIDKESHNRPLINDVINLFSNIYDKNYNKLYKKDEDFYYNVRRYENIPKDINELKIIFDKMKENTILNTNIFPKIINLNSKKKKNISDKKVNNNKNILPSVI